MVVDMRTTPTEDDPSKRNTKLGQEFHKTSEMSSHRESKKCYQIPKQTFWNTQKGLTRGQNNCRPVNSEQMYPVPIFQDANLETGPATPSKTFLDGSAGPERWVLAHYDSQKETGLPRFLLQGPNVEVSRPPFWPQYRPTNFFKINSFSCQGDGIKRHLVPAVPRRLIDYQRNARGMLTSYQNSNFNSDFLRMDFEPTEVEARTSSNLRLARGTIRPYQTYGTSDRREIRLTRDKVALTNNIKILHKKTNHENSGSSELHRTIRSLNKSSNVKDKSAPPLLQKTTFGCKNTHDKRHETQPGQMGVLTKDYTTTRKTDAKHRNSNRRLATRLGISNQSEILPRILRSNSHLLNQHTGTIDCVVCTNTGNRDKCGNSGTVRQRNGGRSSEKRYICNIPASNDFRNHLETSNVSELEPINQPYRGTLQCSSGSIVQEHHSIDRMVATPTRLSKVHTQRKQVPSGRPLRNESESPTESVCISLSRSKGSSCGYNDTQLGEVETPLSVSTLHNDFEGFSEDHRDEVRHGNTSNARDADTTVVHGSTTEEHSVDTDQSTSSTNSSRQTDQGSNTNNTSRVEIIKAALRKRFTGCDAAIDLIATPLRQNSIRDYQHKWDTFILFLNKNNIPLEQITVSSVLQFFTFLFHHKHFKPGTIAHYKTALTVPLKEYFNIDLKDAAFSELLRAMWLQRPNQPNTAPAWSLNKVLKFIDQLKQPMGEKLLLRKTAFLLLLATGWRVSELHACVRNKDYCRFSRNSSLFIRPHPSFLAKNERPNKRWSHKEIKVLKLADGSVSKLCPVTTLKEYLRTSSDITAGPLLLTPGKHHIELSKHQLSTHICSLILQADKTTAANVHDIRTYAASCGFAECMLIGDLISAINWSSPAVFYKFYFTQTEPTPVPVSLPV